MCIVQLLRRIREIDELLQFATIHQEVGAMKLFSFFLFLSSLFFFNNQSASFFFFFFLRYDLDTSTRTDEVEVRIYWNTPPFFFLNSFHAFLDKLRKTFPPFFFFLLATRLSLHRNRTKTENRIFRISRSRNFPLLYKLFEFCFVLAVKVYAYYIYNVYI